MSVYKSFCDAPGRVCFYDPVLHLCVTVYCTRALCCTWTRTCLSTRAGAACTCTCLSNNFVLHLESCSAYKSSACAVLVGVRSTYIGSVCFETGMFVSVHVRNTETKPKNYFSCFMKQTDNRNRLSLVLFCSNRKHFLFFSIKTQSRIFQIFGN